MDINLNGAAVYRRGDTLFVALPAKLARPIVGGCGCFRCKARPGSVPAWDTLAVDGQGAWTVHFPDMPGR